QQWPYGTTIRVVATTVANYNITANGDTTQTVTGAIVFSPAWTTAKLYMQDLTLANCQSQASSDNITVYDRRDESDYTVRYINDACWMTQNLRITKSTGQADWTISSTDSNFNNVSTWNIHGADLKGSRYSYTQAQSHVPTATDADTNGDKPMDTYTADQLGVWYNFCAASANNSNGCNGFGNYTPSTGTVTGDICPAGWHLPTYNTSPGSISGIISYSSAFSPIYGGYYYDGSLFYATTYGYGYWWSTTANGAVSQYGLYYNRGSLYTNFNNKYTGLYVRCVRTS
ncbi:hypothetical protein IJG04_02540, partial [Candidatus Saccharibacteria bacterium]|nr:hypothetical protein [Candidatus Saccharibacteria bacterium]